MEGDFPGWNRTETADAAHCFALRELKITFLNRLTQVTDPDGHTVNQMYDAINRVVRTTFDGETKVTEGKQRCQESLFGHR